MPVRGSINAAGYDCFAARETRIARGTTVAVPLGFSISPSAGVYMRLAETSSWPYEKTMFFLRAGVIDPDFRGPVAALVTYLGPEDFGYINHHERVCQMVPTCFRGDPFHVCHSLPGSGRGENAGYSRFEQNPTGTRCYGCRIHRRPGARGQPDGVRAEPVHEEEEWVPGCAPNELYTLPHEQPGGEEPPAEQQPIPEGNEVEGTRTEEAAATGQPEVQGQEPHRVIPLPGSMEGGSHPPL